MRKTVLIVEDEYLIASHLGGLLEDCGWQIIGPVGTVKEALAMLQLDLPAVALLDVNLGGESVAPVASVLKDRGVPFALATAYPRPEEYGGGVLAGVPNAGKPASKHRLLATLERLIDR